MKRKKHSFLIIVNGWILYMLISLLTSFVHFLFHFFHFSKMTQIMKASTVLVCLVAILQVTESKSLVKRSVHPIDPKALKVRFRNIFILSYYSIQFTRVTINYTIFYTHTGHFFMMWKHNAGSNIKYLTVFCFNTVNGKVLIWSIFVTFLA